MAGKQHLYDLSKIDFDQVLVDREGIGKYNPQRFQMEQLTAIVYENLEEQICVGYKDITNEEFWVQGHMPGMPLMPGVITSHARERFINISPEDRSPRGLTFKLLERPHLCRKIRSLVGDPSRAFIQTYTVTLAERDLALRIGLPLFGSDPSLFYLGGKSGGREVFEKAGVSYPAGSENLQSMDQVCEALTSMMSKRLQSDRRKEESAPWEHSVSSIAAAMAS